MCAQDSPLLTLPNTLLIHPPPTPRNLGFGWVLPSPSWGPGEGSGLFLQVAEGPSPSPTHQVGLALSCAHLHFQGCSVKETVCNCGGKGPGKYVCNAALKSAVFTSSRQDPVPAKHCLHCVQNLLISAAPSYFSPCVRKLLLPAISMFRCPSRLCARISMLKRLAREAS